MVMLNSLWVGSELGYIERLCLLSALSVGHQFTIYSYEHEKLLVPAGVLVKDAREIMPEHRLLRYSDSGAVQLGANLFRYELMRSGVGLWVDMDFCFLKPVDTARDYIFGWEFENWINNAILMTPADAEITYDLCTVPRSNRCPPWYGPKRRLLYFLRRLRGPIHVADFPWGTFSSGMLTYLVKKHGLSNFACAPEVFYPIRWRDAQLAFEPNSSIWHAIRPKTRAVHFWSSRIAAQTKRPPPRGSLVEELCREYGVEV